MQGSMMNKNNFYIQQLRAPMSLLHRYMIHEVFKNELKIESVPEVKIRYFLRTKPQVILESLVI